MLLSTVFHWGSCRIDPFYFYIIYSNFQFCFRASVVCQFCGGASPTCEVLREMERCYSLNKVCSESYFKSMYISLGFSQSQTLKCLHQFWRVSLLLMCCYSFKVQSQAKGSSLLRVPDWCCPTAAPQLPLTLLGSWHALHSEALSQQTPSLALGCQELWEGHPHLAQPVLQRWSDLQEVQKSFNTR